MHLQIAIDGPAGAGKSTIAKAVAKELDILYLDTGAMYRTMALFALEQGIDPQDAEGVLPLLEKANITVQYLDGTQHTFLNGEDVSSRIRTQQVSKGASDIGVHSAVRMKLSELQRSVGEQMPVVMDGRDIGTYVLPNAPFKFYVTASSRARAERRLLDLHKQGQDMPLDQLEQEIIARDYTDSHREFAPLRQAEDALLLDTTDMTAQEAIDTVLSHIKCG